mgnify:FL=1
MIQTNSTWLKLPRSFTSWRWYSESNMVHLYLYLLLQANVKKAEYKTLTIMPGQLVTSHAQISSRTGLSPRNVRTCLQKLSKTNEVNVVSNSRGTIITLQDYGSFQQFDEESNAVGWIKLYRKIMDWSWYVNAEMVHLFVHLLLRASYQPQDLPNGSLGRAQLSLSKNILQQETGISVQSIKTCLKKLQDTGEIEILPNSAFHSNLITISNYCHYQGSSNLTGLNTNIVQNNFVQQNNLYFQNIDFGQEVTSGRNPVTSCVPYGYNAENFRGDKLVTNGRQTTDMLSTNHRQEGDEQLTRNIERYKEEKDKISSSACICAHEAFSESYDLGALERNIAKKPSKESYYDNLRQNKRWLLVICKRYRLATVGAARHLLESFELDMLCRGKDAHVGLQDYMSHFCDWVNKQKPQSDASEYGSKFTPKSSSSGMIYTNQF